jgi:ubiquinone/menaquinone biosynthesis C-methylase UbiE
MNKATQKELNKLVTNNYNKIADHYSETRKKELWPYLTKILNNIPENSHILDVGCGSGKILHAFIEKKINYLGIDPCNGLLNNAHHDFPDYTFQNGDILELGKIPKINFDFVFAIAVLHHIPNKKDRIIALKQLRNKIKTNGEIVISVWDLRSQKKFRKLLWKFWFLKLINKNKMDSGDIVFDWKNKDGIITSKRYYHAFTKKELKKIIKKAKLKIIDFKKTDYNFYLTLKK